MANTITADLFTQVATCRVCGDQTEIPRSLLRDQHRLILFTDDIAQDHRECAATPERPEFARLNREFRKRIEREERKQQDRSRRAA